MIAFGRYIFIYNDTDEKVNDLYFVYPIVKTATKVKRCSPHQHVIEMVADTSYQGDVSFYFETEPSNVYTFTFPKVAQESCVNDTKQDRLYLYLCVVMEEGKRILKLDEQRSYYDD